MIDDAEITDETVDDSRTSSGFHAFWLFREGARDYAAYWDLLGRRDAPIRLSDNVICYLQGTIQWVPSLNPRKDGESIAQHGLNHFGPTVVAAPGGESLRQICLGLAQVLAQGPDPLVLPNGHYKRSGEGPMDWKLQYFAIPKDRLLFALRQLADFGEQVATGEYFLLHLGI